MVAYTVQYSTELFCMWKIWAGRRANPFFSFLSPISYSFLYPFVMEISIKIDINRKKKKINIHCSWLALDIHQFQIAFLFAWMAIKLSSLLFYIHIGFYPLLHLFVYILPWYLIPQNIVIPANSGHMPLTEVECNHGNAFGFIYFYFWYLISVILNL